MGEEIKKKRTRPAASNSGSGSKVETRGRDHKPLISRVHPPTSDAASFPIDAEEEAVMQAVNILRTIGLNVTAKDIKTAHKLNTRGIAYAPRKEDSPKTRRMKKRFLTALELHFGVVSAACAAAGMTRTTHDSWMHSDPDYRDYVAGIDEYGIDFVETKLISKIQQGDKDMLKFYLLTKGKKRYSMPSQNTFGQQGQEAPIRFRKTIVDPQAAEDIIPLNP